MGDQQRDTVIKQEYLRKIKTKRKKYFVLHKESCSGPSRIEYYDSKKLFAQKSLPKRSINLASCFHVEATCDVKNKFIIILYTRDDPFAVGFDAEGDRDEWFSRIKELNTADSQYEHVWSVEIMEKDLGKIYAGSYWLCLKNQLITFVPKITTHDPPLSIFLAYIRSCGDRENFFQLEVGRQSPTGTGAIWMQVEDNTVAQNMHALIVSAMKSSSQSYRERSGSNRVSGNASPMARPPSRQSSTLSRTMEKDRRLSDYPRQRVDSASSHSSSHGTTGSLSVDEGDRASSHGSRSVTPEPPQNRAMSSGAISTLRRESDLRMGGLKLDGGGEASSSLSSMSSSSFGSNPDLPYMAMEPGKKPSQEMRYPEHEGYMDMSVGVVSVPSTSMFGIMSSQTHHIYSQDCDFPNRRNTVGGPTSIRLSAAAAAVVGRRKPASSDQPYVDMASSGVVSGGLRSPVILSDISRSAPHLLPTATRHQSTPQLSFPFSAADTGPMPERDRSPTPSHLSSTGSSLGSARIGHDLHATISSLGSQSDVGHSPDMGHSAIAGGVHGFAYDRPRTASESYHHRPRVSSLGSINAFRQRSASHGIASLKTQRTRPAVSTLASTSPAASSPSYRSGSSQIGGASAAAYMDMRSSSLSSYMGDPPQVCVHPPSSRAVRSASVHVRTQSLDVPTLPIDHHSLSRLSATVDTTGDYVDLGKASRAAAIAAAAASNKENVRCSPYMNRADIGEPFPELSSGSSTEDVAASKSLTSPAHEAPPRRNTSHPPPPSPAPTTCASPPSRDPEVYVEMQPGRGSIGGTSSLAAPPLSGARGSLSGFHGHSLLNMVREASTDHQSPPRETQPTTSTANTATGTPDASPYVMMSPSPDSHSHRPPSPVSHINLDPVPTFIRPLLPSLPGGEGSPSLHRRAPTFPPALPPLPTSTSPPLSTSNAPPLPPLPATPTSSTCAASSQSTDSYMEMSYPISLPTASSVATSSQKDFTTKGVNGSSTGRQTSASSTSAPPPYSACAGGDAAYMAMSFQPNSSSSVSTDGSGGSSETTVGDPPDELLEPSSNPLRPPLPSCSYIRMTSHDSIGELRPVTCYIQDTEEGTTDHENEKDVDESQTQNHKDWSPSVPISPGPIPPVSQTLTNLSSIQEHCHSSTSLPHPAAASDTTAGRRPPLPLLPTGTPQVSDSENKVGLISPSQQQELVYASLDLSGDQPRPLLPSPSAPPDTAIRGNQETATSYAKIDFSRTAAQNNPGK